MSDPQCAYPGEESATRQGPGARWQLRTLPRETWWVCLAGSLASLADWFVLWAVVWSSGLLGWSGAQLAGLLLAARGPALLGGTLGGAAVDRFGAQRMFVVDGLCRAMVAAGLVANGLWNGFGYGACVALVAAAGAMAPVSYSAARTLMPQTVGLTDLGTGNTLLAMGSTLPFLLSGGIVGPALEWVGLTWSFAIPFVLMLLLAAVGTHLARALPSAPDADMVVEAAAGAQVASTGARAWRGRVIPVAASALLGLSTAYYFCFGPFEPSLPLIVRDHLHAEAQTYSLVWSGIGVGCIGGLFVAPTLCSLSRPAVVNASLVVINGIAFVGVARASSLVIALPFALVIGLVWTPYAAVEATALQRLTPPRMHGRIFGLERGLAISALPVGAAVGALMQVRVGPSVMLAGAGLASVLVALVAVSVPVIRTRVPTT